MADILARLSSELTHYGYHGMMGVNGIGITALKYLGLETMSTVA
jgi:hypothetical protein